MSRSINQVILLGHLGQDAETKFTTSGVPKTTFSLATSRRWKDTQSGEWKEETDWHNNIILWRSEKLAEYLKKGAMVMIRGRLAPRTYEAKGEKHWITEIVVDELVLCGGRDANAKPANAPAGRPANREANQKYEPPAGRDLGVSQKDVDEVPF
jgi:single-strand DNA-binding protein